MSTLEEKDVDWGTYWDYHLGRVARMLDYPPQPHETRAWLQGWDDEDEAIRAERNRRALD